MITGIITGAAVAAIGVLFSIVEYKAHKKIDRIENGQKTHHAENVKAREGDRELLLATSEVVEKLARKLNGEGINGELKDAEDTLAEIRENIIKNTRHVYFKHLEGGEGE